jgi:thiol:disulfide interchange protein DsbC
MTAGTVPPKSMDPKCDTSALDRNLAMSRKYKVNGTPALVFENGTRVPGAIGGDQIEKQLANAQKS